MKYKRLFGNPIFLKPLDWPELKKRINKQLDRSDKWIAQINKKKATSIKNSKNIPSNAKIRREYVKCGKSDCPRCKHGPYYYAYWKDDSGKLKKKYIGKYPPSIDKYKSSDIDCPASDTVIDDSNGT